MKLLDIVPRTILLAGVLAAGLAAQPPLVEKPGFDLSTLRHLPVLEGRRFKPFDSLAREFAHSISWKTRIRKTDPMLVYLYWMFEPAKAADDPVIALPAARIAEDLGYDVNDYPGQRISWQEIDPNTPLKIRAEEIYRKEPKKRDPEERAILSFYFRWSRLGEIMGRLAPHHIGLSGDDLVFLPFIPNAGEMQEGVKFEWISPWEASAYLQLLERRRAGGLDDGDVGLFRKLEEKIHQPPAVLAGALERFGAVREAWRADDAAAFNEASKELLAYVEGLDAPTWPASEAMAREVSYNLANPFKKAQWIYVLAAFLSIVAMVARNRITYVLPFVPLVAAVGIHVWGLWERTAVSERAMIGNLYESMLFVSVMAAVIGLVFELIFRRGWLLLSGSGLATLLLFLAHKYPAVLSPEIQTLQPVLINNDWIHIHVPVITCSYSALGLAAIMGHIYLVMYLFRSAHGKQMKDMSRFMYWLIPVGEILLFVGMVLGGIWADASWGRFWGWDPKETWAFITWVSFLIVIHGRWAGWLRDFGTAVGCVMGGWALLWTYWGANFFQSGLHSYAGAAPSKTIPLDLIVYASVALLLLGGATAVRLARGGQDARRDMTPPPGTA